MKGKLIFALFLLAGSGLAANLNADSHEGEGTSLPPLSEVWVMTPKEGHASEFEAAFKEHVAMRKTAGDPRSWDTYTVAMGSEMGSYSVRHCCFDWADQDTYVEWVNGTELDAHWNENVHPHVASYAHYMDVVDWDNSHWPADSGEWNYVGVTRWNPKSGEGAARGEALSKMSSTAKENGWDERWVWLTAVGGPNNLMLAVPYQNYADMAPPETSFYDFMVKHTSEETAVSTFQAFENSFWGAEYTVYQLRRDLSTPRDE